MAFYRDEIPTDAGLLNSLFAISMVAALLGFAIAAAFVVG